MKRLEERNLSSRIHQYYSEKDYAALKPDIKDKRKTVAGFKVTPDLDPDAVFKHADAMITSALKYAK